jgi:uncharacterized Fe-S cluster protein YjdI
MVDWRDSAVNCADERAATIGGGMAMSGRDGDVAERTQQPRPGDARPASVEYRGEAIAVTFDRLRCIHAEECVRGLPAVFNREQRPWIQLARGNPADVADVVERCPSGALQYRRLTLGPEERPEDPPRITVVPNGPLYVRGDFEYPTASGESVRSPRAALCRCGGSANKPFCDNTHLRIGFEAP